MRRSVSTRKSRIGNAVTVLDPHRKLVAMIVLVMPVTAVFAALEPLLYKLVFDRLASNVRASNVLVALGAVVAAATIREVLTGCAGWLSWRMGLTVNYQLKTASASRSLPNHNPPEDAGEGIVTKVNRCTRRFTAALSELAFGLLPGVVYLVIASVAMFSLDRRLTLVVLFLAALPLLTRSIRAGTNLRMPSMPAHGTLLCCGLFLLLRGETTVGTVMAFFCYQLGMPAPVASLIRTFRTLRIATSAHSPTTLS